MDKEIKMLGIKLLIITAVSGLLLGITYNITQKAIAARGGETAAYKELIPDAEKFEKADVKLTGNIKEVQNAIKDGATTGYIIKVQAKGYGGPVTLMVAVDDNGTVTNLNISADNETAGLGKESEKPKFKDQFKGKTANTELKVSKNAKSDDEIQAVSGATITSTGVTNGVNEALEFFNDALKEGQN